MLSLVRITMFLKQLQLQMTVLILSSHPLVSICSLQVPSLCYNSSPVVNTFTLSELTSDTCILNRPN